MVCLLTKAQLLRGYVEEAKIVLIFERGPDKKQGNRFLESPTSREFRKELYSHSRTKKVEGKGRWCVWLK